MATSTELRVQLLREGEPAYHTEDPGTEISRAITVAGFTRLGGGWCRMDGTGAGHDWTLHYDEVLYVVSGQLEIECEGQSTFAGKGEAILIRDGATVQYRSKPNTKLFYAIYPRDWNKAGS